MNIQLKLWDEPEEEVQIPENDVSEKWKRFHNDNPQVYDLIKHFTFQAINAGHKHYSIQMITERVRWHTMIETNGEPFKMNNSHNAYYARLFMKDHPEHAGFFRTRKTRQLNNKGAANDAT